MGGVSVKLAKADFATKAEGLSDRGVRAIKHAVASSMVAHSDQYVPFLTGALKNSAVQNQSSWEEGIIRYGVRGTSYNYAAYQYYTQGLNHSTVHGAGRRDHWLEWVQSHYAKQLVIVAQQAVKEAKRL